MAKGEQHLLKQRLFLSYLALIIWAPLPLGSNRPWSWSLLEAALFILLGVLLWRDRTPLFPRWVPKWGGAKGNKARQPGHPLGVMSPVPWLLLFVALNGVTLVSGHTSATEHFSLADPVSTVFHLRLSLAFAAFLYLTLRLIDNPQKLRWLAATVVISGVFQALYGSLMTLSGAEYGFFIKKAGYEGMATGTFWNRNHLAGFLNICLAFGTGLLLAQLYDNPAVNRREVGRRLVATLLGEKMRLRAGLVMMVIALVLTKSRMGNAAFFLSLVLAAVAWLALARKFNRSSVLFLLSLLVIDTLIVGGWFGIDKVKERMQSTTFTEETRDEVNRDMRLVLDEHLWVGTGAGSFYAVYPEYRGADVAKFYGHGHNDYAELLLEHGVFGVWPLAVILILAYYNAVRAILERKTMIYRAMSFAVLMGLTASLLQALVEFNLQIPANALMVLLLVGLAWVIRFAPSGQRIRKRRIVTR